MTPFTFQTTPNVLFEPGAAKKIAGLVSEFGARRVLFVTDKGCEMAKAAGAGDTASFQAFAPDSRASRRRARTSREPEGHRSGQPPHGGDAGQDLRPARMVLGH